MRPVKAIFIALSTLIITSELATMVWSSCFGCCGGRKTTQIHPVPDCGPNSTALFDDRHSVRYFRIKEALPQRMVDVGKFVALGMAYSIVELLDFVGWHLPLKHSRSAHTFQSILNYFVEFESGVDKISDPHRVKMGFGIIYSLRHLILH